MVLISACSLPPQDRLTASGTWSSFMRTYVVNVTIENKPGISDPEGDTIFNDLVIKSGSKHVSGIRTARMLKFTIRERDKKAAKAEIQRICDDLRIYNPLVSKVAITVLPERAKN